MGMCQCRSVAIVGIDGSGKTTMAKCLQQALSDRGARVVMIHPYGRPILRHLPGFSPATTPHGHSRLPSSRWLSRPTALLNLVEIMVYVWLAQARCILISRLERNPVWLISDRSGDSMLAKLLYLHALPRSLVNRLARVLPRGQATIWLRIDPGEAMRRDRDFPYAYYQGMDQAHAVLGKQLGWIEIDASSAPEALCSTVVQCLEPLDACTCIQSGGERLWMTPS
jgi:thymidylate kinase